MDISFLLATIRYPADFVKQAIQSIYDLHNLDKYSYEIIVVSQMKIDDGLNLRWLLDKEPGTGGVHAYNQAYCGSTGNYIIPMVDDLALPSTALELVEILKSPQYQHKRFKVICMQTVSPGPFYTSTPGSPSSWPTSCFPVLDRTTIRDGLNNYLLNPQLKHGNADNWLAYWLYAHGESPYWHPNHQLRELAVAACNTAVAEDTEMFTRLVNEHRSGKRTKYAP